MSHLSCQRCGLVLQAPQRSPLCYPCWLDHQKERNKANVRAYRERQRIFHPPPEPGSSP